MLDKKAVWGASIEMIETAVGPSMFHALVDNCYLDSLENGTAIIAADSEFMRDIIHRKASRKLAIVFTELLKRPIKVKVVVGHPRIFEIKSKTFTPSQHSRENEPNDAELAMLHERYGDIMGIVDNHPIFKKACAPLDKGGWGIFPQLLTNACKDYGVMAVLTGLRYTANRPSVINPRAFFFTALRKGQFGHRLAIGANVIGPAKAETLTR